MVISNDLECYNIIQKDNSLLQIEININKSLSDFLNSDLSESSISLLVEKYGNPYLSFDSVLRFWGVRESKISLSLLTNPTGVKYSIYRMQRLVELLTSYKNKNYENILYNVLQLLLITDPHFNEYPIDTYSSCTCFGNIFENLSYSNHAEIILDGISRDEYITLPVNSKITLLSKQFYEVLKAYNYKFEGIFCNYIDLLSCISQLTKITISEDNIIIIDNSLSDLLSAFSDINITILMNCAREIIESEMKIHVHDVNPSFIISEEGYKSGWSFNNLFSALYMKIQLIYSDSKVIKKCENPTCDEYFELPTNNTVKKYCSTRCAQLMAKRKQRDREKENNK